MISDSRYARRMLQTVLTVAATGILLAALWAARDALMLIYISALIAMGFSPLVRGIERTRDKRGRRRVPRLVAIFVIYIAIIGIFVLLGLMVIPPLVSQARELGTQLPSQFEDFQRFLIRYRLMTRSVTLQEAVQNAPAGTGGNAVTTVLGAITGVIGGVFGLITIVILSFYLLIEADSIVHYLLRFVPGPRRDAVATAARAAVQKVSAWLRAQLVLAGFMGVFAAVGLGLMGEPYFYVVALVAAIGETIPIVGPIIGGITAVTVAIATSPKLAVSVGIYFLVLHQLEANILVPKIMERQVGVSPVAVLVALLVGGSLWGIIGAILAIPTTAILAVIVDEFTGAPDSGSA
jgi:predicted PurR-regulated permease PerM